MRLNNYDLKAASISNYFFNFVFFVSFVALFSLNVSAQSKPQVLFTSPDQGSVTGGTAVKIAGANFQDGAKVIWDGKEIPVSFIDSGFLMIMTPSSVPGAIDITVTNPDGGSGTLPQGFLYQGQVPSPKVKLIAPTETTVLSAGGDPITINWQIESDRLTDQRLLLSTDGGATFPIIIADNLNLSTRRYVWLIPAELAVNTARLRIEARALDSIGLDDSQKDLKVIAAPRIESISPATASASRATINLEITGAGFAKGAIVEIGDQKIKAKQITDNSIRLERVNLPAPGSYLIRVRNRNRTISLGYLFTVAQ